MSTAIDTSVKTKALFCWYNNLSSTLSSTDTLEDGQALCRFAQQTLSLSGTATNSSSATTTNKPFRTLHRLLQSFLSSDAFTAQNEEEPLHTNQLDDLLKQHTEPLHLVVISLELLLCCCVCHPILETREEAVETIMALPIEHQQLLMEVIEQRLSPRTNNITIVEDDSFQNNLARTPLRTNHNRNNTNTSSSLPSAASSASTCSFRSSTKQPHRAHRTYRHTTTNKTNKNTPLKHPTHTSSSPSMTPSPLSMSDTRTSSPAYNTRTIDTDTQQFNRITTLMSDVSHLQYVIRTKRDHNIELANQLDVAHSKITTLEQENQRTMEYKQNYLHALDELELIKDEKKQMHKQVTTMVAQMKRMKSQLDKRNSDLNDSNAVVQQKNELSHDNYGLLQKNTKLNQTIQCLHMNIDKRDAMHKTDMSEMRRKMTHLELLVKEKEYALAQSTCKYGDGGVLVDLSVGSSGSSGSGGSSGSKSKRSSHQCDQRTEQLKSGSSRSPSLSPSNLALHRRRRVASSSPFSMPSFSPPSTTITLHEEMHQINTQQINDQLTTQMQTMQEEHANTLIDMQEKEAIHRNEQIKALQNQHAVGIHEQRHNHRESLRVLRQEYSELQMTIASDSNAEIVRLREEHQQIVLELVEMFNCKCDALVEQRDEYAEEVERLRKRCRRMKKEKRQGVR